MRSDTIVSPNAEPEVELLQHLRALEELIARAERNAPRGTSASATDWVKAHEAEIRARMEALGAAIHTFLESQPPAETVARVYTVVTTQLRAWSSASPLFHRIYHVPRAQLDPYEISDLVLANRPAGADLAGHMMDNFYLNTVTARSFRLRIQRLASVLQAETQKRVEDRRPVRILNLHTGVARELDLLAQDRMLRPHVHLTCLDTDAAALRRVRSRLGSSFQRGAEFQLGDPRKVTASRLWPDAPYDIIYALVLCDQLSDRQVWPLIANCHRGLRPGGLLILGNYATSMPVGEYHLIHWVLNFNIRHRDEAALRGLFGRTPFGAEAPRIELDPWRAGFLIMAQRQ